MLNYVTLNEGKVSVSHGRNFGVVADKVQLTLTH